MSCGGLVGSTASTMVEATTPNPSETWVWEVPDHHGNQGHTTDPVANQCCSSANWVLIEVLEEGYGHSFGIWGLGRGPLRPSP